MRQAETFSEGKTPVSEITGTNTLRKQKIPKNKTPEIKCGATLLN